MSGPHKDESKRSLLHPHLFFVYLHHGTHPHHRKIRPEFSTRVPLARTILIEADVTNLPTSVAQRKEMDRLDADITSRRFP